jgi:glutathione peroxidase
MATNIYDLKLKTLTGTSIFLNEFADQVLLIVNTASACGYTPQYAGLETLQRSYRDSGFSVLGFPCNQFGKQEPGTAEQIAEFCRTRYEVSFPMFAKIEVNGPGTHPLFAYLKSAKRGLFGSQNIKWNFTKFLIDRDGNVVARYAPKVTPERIEPEIVRLL